MKNIKDDRILGGPVVPPISGNLRVQYNKDSKIMASGSKCHSLKGFGAYPVQGLEHLTVMEVRTTNNHIQRKKLLGSWGIVSKRENFWYSQPPNMST